MPGSLKVYRSNIHSRLTMWSGFILVLLIAKNYVDGKLTSTSDSAPQVRDCSDLDRKHYRSGVYKIYPAGGAGFKAYCDMETDGGGWTVFQHRQDGKVDFCKGWEEYANGFGNLKTEFWLGNDKLHKITPKGQYELRVNLEDFNSDRAYAKYSSFYIGDRSTNYKLKVKGYSGTAGDSLTPHNNQAFTTKDKDNDIHSSENCAKYYKGAWWYSNCHVSNLNGLYLGNKKDNKGMRWKQWKGSQSVKTTSMMIRRKRPKQSVLQVSLKKHANKLLY